NSQKLPADLVERVNHALRLTRIFCEVFVETGRLGDGNAVEVIHHAQWPIERCVRRIEPEENAKRLIVRLLEPCYGFLGEQVIDVFVVGASFSELTFYAFGDDWILI